MKGRIRIIITLFMVGILSVSSAVPALAAGKNESRKMASDPDVKKICKMVTSYTTAMRLGELTKDGKNVISLKDQNRLNIAAFVRYNFKGDYAYTKGELEKTTKELFGKKADVNAVSKKDKPDVIVYKAKKNDYQYCGGDFGDCIPTFKVLKTTKIKKDTYVITTQNLLRYYESSDKDVLGITEITLKKNHSSTYGYVVKSIVYTTR